MKRAKLDKLFARQEVVDLGRQDAGWPEAAVEHGVYLCSIHSVVAGFRAFLAEKESQWLLHGRRDPPADVFSLGVVMLRCITLPDKERGWDVNAIQKRAPRATNSMTAHIRRRRDELQVAGASSKETKLRSLVRRMLLDTETRISACNLANQTAGFSITFFHIRCISL
jgi:hypothetical protein